MRIIAHLDMDAFFAAVEERDRPALKGKPIVVGADPKNGRGRGVVSTASYAARTYGIRSAMPISEAWRRAEAARREGKPAAVFLEVNMGKYGEVSRRVMEILARRAAVVEQTSVDEAYLELSGCGSYEKAEELCAEIKKEIWGNERLTASVGIGPNRLVAKLATEMQKPDGLTVIRTENVERALDPLSIRAIPGVGPKTEARFAAQGIRTVRDAKQYSETELAETFGKWGAELYWKLRGEDNAPIGVFEEAKSAGEQETFEEDTRDAGFLVNRLAALAEGVLRRLSREGFRTFGRVVVTVRFSDFTTKTRSKTLAGPAGDRAILEFEALRLFLPFLDARENPGRKTFRLIGVRVEKLS